MCKAFSGIVDPMCKVTWKMGVDSHSDLAKLAGYKDQVAEEFAKFEITPKNGNYLAPDGWVFRWDEDSLPAWADVRCKEAALAAHKKWLKALDKLLVRKPVVHPFRRDRTPPVKITKRHIKLLREWDSVGNSVWDSVRNSVRNSVGSSVWSSVWSSVRNSVGSSVGSSVWSSVNAYIGSFFNIPKWQGVEHKRGSGYPFASVVKLWEMGLVPSFDGSVWRLHGGKGKEGCKVVYEITAEELRKGTGKGKGKR
jgi:hypothetical protein